ncbi:MAG: hypothetical protein Q4F74_06825, partial [Synergistaceae bacterium]|nr:hypothetical protein [Synergistaceae bacterium]
MGKLFKESKMVFVAALLTAFAVVFSGGCGGSSDGQGAKQSTLYIYGTMPEGYDSYFASADIACRPYDSETFPVGGSILITPGVMEKMTVNDPVAKVIKENYDGNGHIVLMSPSANEITKLRSILGIEDNSALVAGLPHETTLFGIELEKDGDTHVFCHHQDNDIFDGTVDEAVSGICAVKSGDIYEIISDDTLLGTTNDVAVKEGVGGSITAVLNGASVDCHGLTDVTVGYIVSGDTVCKYDIEESPDEAEIELWSSDFVTGLKNLRKWLLAQNADDLVVGASTASAALVSQRTAGNSQSEVEKNLIDLAKQYKITLSNNDFGKSFVLNQYIIACHIFENEDSATGGRDYYYIEQRGILDSSANYLKKWAGTRYRTRLDWKKYYVGQGEVVDDYIRKYEITNKISNPPADWALEGQPSPVASNHDNTTTSSIGWSIGAGVSGGYKGGGGGPEVSGSLSFGYSCTNTKT